MIETDYEARSGRKRFFSILDEGMKLLLDPRTGELRDPFASPETRYLPVRLRKMVENRDGWATIERLIHELGMGYRLRVLARREA